MSSRLRYGPPEICILWIRTTLRILQSPPPAVQWFPFRRWKLLRQICSSATKTLFCTFGLSLKSFCYLCGACSHIYGRTPAHVTLNVRLKGQLEWQPIVNSCWEYHCLWRRVFLTPKALCCNLLQSSAWFDLTGFCVYRPLYPSVWLLKGHCEF